ncbi:hypothetical protein [Kushneria aurantia]|uniref:Type 4 fimbrial biogenesis protein PilX N-terminal domain-containing protein n=1 Tax=Kushneria aurantia TaxID=504092 RepID=A0ABV6FZD7_9GAMM|nr:hypothetical protein [Kushneria aurantia]
MATEIRRQGGFALLIGLILLSGMTLLALSLVQRGLLDTRFAYRAMEGTTDFQQQEGSLESRRGDIDELVRDHLDLACGQQYAATGSERLEMRQLCDTARMPTPPAEIREHLERRYSTSFGARDNQGLSNFRYFELRAEPPAADGGNSGGNDNLYQGILSLGTGGAS